MDKVYLKPIKISEGQFSNEKAVVLMCSDGTETAGFIEKEKLKQGRLEVSIVKEEGNLALVNLHCRMLEPPGDKGYLTVKKTDLNYE